MQSKVVKKIMGTIHHYLQEKESNHQILEPISTIVRLGILSYKDVGTKIAISDNTIYFQDPTPLQGPIRWTFGNKRTDIHYLMRPIIRAVKNYDAKNNANIRCIFKLARDGLLRLKSSYNNKSSIVCHSLDLYIFLLEKAMQEGVLSDFKKDSITEVISQQVYSIFCDLWENKQFGIVCALFEQAKLNKETEQYYIEAIECILRSKDAAISKVIRKTSDSI